MAALERACIAAARSLRKLVHMGVGGIAFAMRYLGPLGSALAAAGAR